MMRRLTNGPRLVVALLFAAAVLGPAAAGAQSAAPPKPSEPGSPVAITKVAGYTESTTRAGVTVSSTHLVCISFENVSDKTLKSVTFELSHRRADGTASEVKTHRRDGTFSPGVEIRGYQGESVGRPDSHALSNCPPFSQLVPGLGDAIATVIRPIEATFEDGTTWTAARPPLTASAGPTPAPVIAETEPAPPWDAAHHAGYLAVVSGGGTLAKPAPQLVSVYAPGRRIPSATFTFPKCCVMAVAFDGAGNLIVGTMGLHDGVLVYAPGSAEPAKRLPEHDGFSVAYDDAGDIAIGGYNSGPDIAVYPHAGNAYRITGQPVPGGLAMSPAGEIAVIEYKSRMVRTYAAGATTPSRQIPFDTAEKPRTDVHPLGKIAYGANGDLAVLDYSGGTIRIFEPGHDQPAYTVRAGGTTLAIDGTGRLFVGGSQGTAVYDAHGNVLSTISHGGSAIAADRTGRAAISNRYRNEVYVIDGDGKQFTVPVPTGPSEIAISP
jgi:hypothetical protein